MQGAKRHNLVNEKSRKTTIQGFMQDRFKYDNVEKNAIMKISLYFYYF